jgi:hypothetical protein
MAEPRTPKLVIDQAIRENRRAEYLCYVFAVAFVAGGLFALVWGAVTGGGVVAAVGTIASVLFYPALAAAREIREDNMAIRLLEIALDKATTADEAAKALNDAFTRLFVERKVR